MKHLLLNSTDNFFHQEFWGVNITNYLWFSGIIVITLLIKKLIANVLTTISSKVATRISSIAYKTEMHKMLLKPVERLIVIILFYFAFNFLSDLFEKITLYRSRTKGNGLEISLQDVFEHVFLLLFIYYLAQVINHIIDFFYYLRTRKLIGNKNPDRLQLFPLMKEVSKIAIWTTSVFFVLGTVFHVNIPALITGLGIGGVAIALAGKETVENFIAAFTILTDKPFLAGHYVRLAEFEGIIERIGFRSTRIRAFDESIIVIPNQKLVSQNLINYSTRNAQGYKITVNIRYGLSSQKLDNLISSLKEYFQQQKFIVKPVEISMETFNPESFALIIFYTMPSPLPDSKNLIDQKREVSLAVYDIITSHIELGNNPIYKFQISNDAVPILKKDA